MDVSNAERLSESHAEAVENEEPSLIERPFNAEAETRRDPSHFSSAEPPGPQQHGPHDVMMISKVWMEGFR